jgi:hypothetical protein
MLHFACFLPLAPPPKPVFCIPSSLPPWPSILVQWTPVDSFVDTGIPFLFSALPAFTRRDAIMFAQVSFTFLPVSDTRLIPDDDKNQPADGYYD